MSTYWYCCQCGHGGYNVAVNTFCPECFHNRCSYCSTVNHDTPYSYSEGGAGVAANHSPPLRAMTSAPLVPEHAMLDHGCFPAPSAAPSDPEEYYWQCCSCKSGFMSYALETGCNNCWNHNRCGSCPIEVVKR
ncbi:hypothetical protein DM02DRAFT_570684 [Periconia macrospinosa]|uniref:Uncharacterized protein n=1 Tax=Periconia macrospinosa TaxID=97972 RepID=A0A2V1DC68_9PLEO|nr:hypothetical protein DM02DRAFT_570684 [Periconia macrospinosa]